MGTGWWKLGGRTCEAYERTTDTGHKFSQCCFGARPEFGGSAATAACLHQRHLRPIPGQRGTLGNIHLKLLDQAAAPGLRNPLEPTYVLLREMRLFAPSVGPRRRRVQFENRRGFEALPEE